MVVLVVDDMQALEKSVGAMHQEMIKQMSEVQSSLATHMDLMLSRIDDFEDLLKQKKAAPVSFPVTHGENDQSTAQPAPIPLESNSFEPPPVPASPLPLASDPVESTQA
ncbi:hypothetical protein Patl1_11452 [Pistacia atlantica]|uniref:Uncharacterized protein n=1 Tax=Pistacia atlantica TaxID=434234 RepID=A0ACC1A573_9ROSI|nr:hypothetical protein Patl1_11452 [Pistacia atlantica]